MLRSARFFIIAALPGKFSARTRLVAIRSSRGLFGCAVWSIERARFQPLYLHSRHAGRKDIGRPASYGCIRMKSNDVTALYDQVQLGAVVQIVPDQLPKVPRRNRLPIIDHDQRQTDRQKLDRSAPNSQEAACGKSARSGVKAQRRSASGMIASAERALLDSPFVLRDPPRSQFC